MESIGKIITRLRRDRGLTQEELAELIGVTNSTISKWETGTNVPDVYMIPVVANALGVSINTLYDYPNERQRMTAEEAYDAGMDAMGALIARLGWSFGAAESPEKYREDYEKCAQEHPGMRSLILRKQGAVYLRKAMGAVLLKQPEKGWISLLTDERNQQLLKWLADDDFRRVLAVLFKGKMSTFTLGTLAKHSGVKDIARSVEILVDCCFAREKTLDVDGQDIRYYEVVHNHRMFMLFAVLACATEFMTYEDWHWCFAGSEDWHLQ